MAQIERNSIIQKAINELRLNPSAEKIPKETSDKIQLGYSLNPNYTEEVKSVATSSTGNFDIVSATSSVKDTYLTFVTLSIAKNAAANTTTESLILRTTINGASRDILLINFIDLTALDSTITLPLPYPLKVDRNSAITVLNGNFTAGVCRRGASVGFFEVDRT